MAKLAWIGLGVMGFPMAGHLALKGGHDVTVYNRSAAKAQAWTGDAMRIKQVLHNLLGNAIKFTVHGEVGLQVGALDGGGLRFTVHDTGPGLETARHPRLFRRFEQGDAPAVDASHAGSGLGLAISRELVLAMGGRIAALGVPGKGTRFVVELPLDPVPTPDRAYREAAPRKSMTPAM